MNCLLITKHGKTIKPNRVPVLRQIMIHTLQIWPLLKFPEIFTLKDIRRGNWDFTFLQRLETIRYRNVAPSNGNLHFLGHGWSWKIHLRCFFVGDKKHWPFVDHGHIQHNSLPGYRRESWVKSVEPCKAWLSIQHRLDLSLKSAIHVIYSKEGRFLSRVAKPLTTCAIGILCLEYWLRSL